MRRIPGKDAIFLYMDSPAHPMHIGFVGVFDPSTIPGGIDSPAEIYERLLVLLEQRIHLFPPFRQRLVTVPLGLDHPVFIEDPAFDLAYHVRRGALPAPGGRQELEAMVSDLMSRPMDMSHPLWELHVVEGVEDGRWALIAKAHHVIVDGVGGNEILVNLLDLEPEPRPVDPPTQPWEPEEVPSELGLVGKAVARTVTNPPRLARTVLGTLGTVGKVVRDRIAGGDEDPPIATLGPRTLLNQPITSHRQVALGKVSLDDVKQVKDAHGVKVNDVVLAMCGRGLRRFLAEHGDEPAKALVAAVPISVRTGGEDEAGNQVSGMTVPLADDLEDVSEQLRRINKVTAVYKERLGGIAADLMTDWAQFATPALAAQAFRFYSSMQLQRRHPPVANLLISNVPGPPVPLHVAGSRMVSMYPIGPVFYGQALNITVVSYLDEMFVGVVACPDAVPGVPSVVGHITKALDEMVSTVEAPR